MKYIILLGDGMADYPLEALGGRTPLEAARTPNMDRIAAEGTVGLVDTIPAGFKPGSDVANLTVLGYDPASCYTGRGPLEAANMGVSLGPGDVAFRCNLVTLGDGEDPVMEDFTAGHITTGEARLIVEDLQKAMGNEVYQFYPGVSYRHLFVWRDGREGMEATPPHDITGRPTKAYLPRGDGAGFILRVMEEAKGHLRAHPVNLARLEKGKRPANAIWLWGQGRAPRMKTIEERFGLKGAVISAVDLLNGIGVYAGLSPIRVPGATGYIDTNYVGKAEGALAALKEVDLVFVHVEAPDEMGHEGNLEGKIKAIEDFDEKVVGTVLRALPTLGPARLMVLSDHPTPISVRTHTGEASPFAVFSTVAGENMAQGLTYGEKAGRESGIVVSPGWRLMELFVGDWKNGIRSL
ncbi:MAG TPA: cofactor-independent phosphoglycerate mutase [Syntrophales bacterium]|nr:cofactor-independent phosphoglycerate mutase [Syntrophales bacterium]HOM07066.1 cofactor-independent phosphoglycerate mutase [Syntrophales bacterium]HON98897.1 cofactor-independent phosphoglycerate mutase [Syntrophales bacterium]HPQ06565.1 cofactor-independent phosphoglycerate mutase [Syntrophales bacterium]